MFNIIIKIDSTLPSLKGHGEKSTSNSAAEKQNRKTSFLIKMEYSAEDAKALVEQ